MWPPIGSSKNKQILTNFPLYRWPLQDSNMVLYCQSVFDFSMLVHQAKEKQNNAYLFTCYSSIELWVKIC